DQHRAMAEFLDDQHGGVLIDGLVDGGHGAELHQLLDHHRGLHRHALGQFAHLDALRHLDVVDDLVGGPLEGVAVLDAHHGGGGLQARLLVAVLAVVDDQELLGALLATLDVLGLDLLLVELGLFVLFVLAGLFLDQLVAGLGFHRWDGPRLARLLAGNGSALDGLAVRGLGGGLDSIGLGVAAPFLLFRLAAVLDGGEAPGLGVVHQGRARGDRGRGGRGRGIHRRRIGLGSFELLATAVDITALDVGALLAHLHVDGFLAGGFQGADGLAAQGDLGGLGGLFPVETFQIRQQLLFLRIGNRFIRRGMLQPRFTHLLEQTVYGCPNDLGKLTHGNFSHSMSSPIMHSEPDGTQSSANQGARAVMISAAARSSSIPSISSRSSTACSARSSMVTMPRLARILASVASMPSMVSRSSAVSAWASPSSVASARVSRASLDRYRSTTAMSLSKPSMSIISSRGT